MEKRSISEQPFINREPDVYRRFSQPGVHYLLPLSPSIPQIELRPPRFLEGTNLTNMEHTRATPIPVYTLPEVSPALIDIDGQLLNHIKTNVKELSITIPAFQKLEPLLTNQDDYAYRGAKVTIEELALEKEEPQLNKLISLSTYGLDYPTQNGSRSSGISMHLNALYPTMNFLYNSAAFDMLPELMAKYSLLMIYKAEGLDYTEEPMNYDVFGKKDPRFYGVKIMDNETLRDKLQAVVLIPWADEEKK